MHRVVALASLFALGCAQDARDASRARAAERIVGPSPSELADAARALLVYDDLRDALARGDASDAVQQARLLEDAAARAYAPAGMSPLLRDLSSSAAAVRLAKNDIGAMRRAFADVSAATIAIVQVAPGLQGSYRVYRCDQVPGAAWLATPADAALNPYLGEPGAACAREAGTPPPPGERDQKRFWM